VDWWTAAAGLLQLSKERKKKCGFRRKWRHASDFHWTFKRIEGYTGLCTFSTDSLKTEESWEYFGGPRVDGCCTYDPPENIYIFITVRAARLHLRLLAQHDAKLKISLR
jgi:hypothetical protein